MGMMHLDYIDVGSQVEIELVDRTGKKDRLTMVIVPENAADFSHGYLSENTPLAKAILGEHTGSIIPYLKDEILSIEILSVTRSANQPPMDAAEKRRVQMVKTMREVENTNAMVFASSFSGKWGDYDPDSIPHEKNPDESAQENNNNRS